MTQDNKNIAEQTTESGSLGSTAQASGKQLGDVKASASDLAGKVGEIEKELAHVSAALQKEAKTATAMLWIWLSIQAATPGQGLAWLKAWLEKVWEKCWVAAWERC